MKPKVSIENVVLVRLEQVEGSPPLNGEVGLATRLLEWALRERIYGRFAAASPDYFSALYEPEGAERIRQWLSEQPECGTGPTTEPS